MAEPHPRRRSYRRHSSTQIVSTCDNPLYADILRRFKAATGLPILVNTSFNVHEEPVVNRPAECLLALRDHRVDFVVTEQSCYSL